MKNKLNLIGVGVFLAKHFEVEYPFDIQYADSSRDLKIPFRVYIDPEPSLYTFVGEVFPMSLNTEYEDVFFEMIGTGGSGERPSEIIFAAYSKRAKKIIILDKDGD